jgi:hypothetical protein
MRAVQTILSAATALVSVSSLTNFVSAQNRTSGCGSPVILNSKINQLEIKCVQRNSELANTVRRLNDLTKRKFLTSADLKEIAAGLNAKIDHISNNTDETLAMTKEIWGILNHRPNEPRYVRDSLLAYLEGQGTLSSSPTSVQFYPKYTNVNNVDVEIFPCDDQDGTVLCTVYVTAGARGGSWMMNRQTSIQEQNGPPVSPSLVIIGNEKHDPNQFGRQVKLSPRTRTRVIYRFEGIKHPDRLETLNLTVCCTRNIPFQTQ